MGVLFAEVPTTGDKWIDVFIWAVFIAAVFTMFAKKVLVPLVRAIQGVVHAIDKFGEVIPVLIDIGEQFHENGGNSLKDSLNRIEGQLKASGEVQVAQGTKLDDLHQYAHAQNHERRNDITKLALADATVLDRLDRLSEHLSPIPAKLDAIAVAAGAADASAVEHRESHPESPGE